MDSANQTGKPIVGQAVCDSAALIDAGPGVRFTTHHAGQSVQAFAVRYGGVARAYLNRCGHRGIELDWEPGRFFDIDGRWLICAAHGALYDPASGACVGGACRGAGLVALAVDEIDGCVRVKPPSAKSG